MGLGDLFKSQKEREREKERRRRKAVRNAERITDDLKAEGAKIKKEMAKQWQEAAQLLRDGNKAGSNRALQTHRAMGMEADRVERRSWSYSQIARRLRLASTDQAMTGSLRELCAAVEIDPDALEEALAGAEDKIADTVDSDKIWERFHDREMEGIQTAEMEGMPSMEEMQAQLAAEVLGETTAPAAGETGLGDALRQSQERLERIREQIK